jgi:hypothetical protein
MLLSLSLYIYIYVLFNIRTMQFRKKDERKKNTKDLSSMIKDSSRVRGTLFLSLFFCACALSSVVDFFRKQASKQASNDASPFS